MWYRPDFQMLADEDTLAGIVRAGYDALFYVVKDYNGEWVTPAEVEVLRDIRQRYSLKMFGWVCCMTEGYVGELAAQGRAPEFARSAWSVCDVDGNDTIQRPIPCDLGLEQYACPANQHHTDVLLAGVGKLSSLELFEGFLYDFVRYPLELEYCYCLACDQLALELFGSDIHTLSPLEKFELRRIGVQRFVEQAERATTSWSTYLVWPDLGVPDLRRSQRYQSWEVSRISPMLYPTLGTDWRTMLRRVEADFRGEVVPLLLSSNPLVDVPIERTSPVAAIVTHYASRRWASGERASRSARWKQSLHRWAYAGVASARFAAAVARHYFQGLAPALDRLFAVGRSTRSHRSSP